MTDSTPTPETILQRCIVSGRIHSAYLLAGPGDLPRDAALKFARALACTSDGEQRPCEACSSCRRSGGREITPLDGTGKKGPLYRTLGDHPDLLWVERGENDTRVRIGQIRALQAALRYAANEGGRRAVVIADAEWLNAEAQNALLRLLEEPPRDTTLILVTAAPAGLLATVRSRCQRIVFPPPPRDLLSDLDNSSAVRILVEELNSLGKLPMVDLLDWAERYRGERSKTVAGVTTLLETSVAWLQQRVHHKVDAGSRMLDRELTAFSVVSACRKSLAQRNANPQMVAERTLLALREVDR